MTLAPERGPETASATTGVTVALTCWNAAWCIERALDSVFAQTRLPDQVIVTDDGSTDDTVERIRSRYGDRVRVVSLPHRGLTPTRRAAIEESEPSSSGIAARTPKTPPPVSAADMTCHLPRRGPRSAMLSARP